MKYHWIKCIQPYFGLVWNGTKTFEVRLNDRDYKVGDIVFINDYDSEKREYGNRSVQVEITYILSNYPVIQQDHIVFAFQIKERYNKRVIQA